MPDTTDPSIILGVKQPQIDLAAIMGNALQLKQMQQQQQTQNTLKSILAQPGALDANGAPTPNTLASIARVGPAGLELSSKLADQTSLAEQRKAQIAHDTSETRMDDLKNAHEALTSGLDVYDAELASGVTDPKIAESNLKTSLHDFIYSQPWSDERKNQNWQTLSGLDPAGLRTAASKLSMTVEERQRQAALTEEKTPATMNGKPVLVDKAGSVYDPNSDKKIEVTGEIVKQEPGFNPQAAATKVDERPPIQLQDSSGNPIFGYQNPDRTITWKNSAGDTVPAPDRVSHIASGNPRSGAAAYVQAYLADPKNDHSAEGIANAMAQYAKTQTAGTADVKAEAAGLQNLGKMRASVAQAEGNASREAGLVESLLDKGGIQGIPSALGKWQNSARTGVFNDPDASAFQTAVESFKNEYVKVLSTQGGMSGGMSSDAARREADQYINPRLSKDQIRANINVMRQSMANRTAAIDKAYADTQARVSEAGKGPSAPSTRERTATGPNGQKIALRDGRWVDVKTGEPVQ
jgi:hypothetical protein